MTGADNRVLIVGAGPVGLCLALKLAQAGVQSTVIEQLRNENFLDQVPRAGTNHAATLEMYDDIGLYEKLEPRGIIAPLFHYWDREKGERIAEFNHAVLSGDTRFAFALQCERIKIVEEGLAMAKAEPLIDVRMATNFTGFTQDADGVTRLRRERSRRTGEHSRPLYRQRGRRAQYRAQRMRHRIRGIHLSGPDAQHRSRL